MKNIFKNKKIKFAIKAMVSLAFVVYVIYEVDWFDVWENVKKVEWWQALLYVAVLVLGMVISAHKWRFLARHKGFRFSFFEYFKFYLTGTFVNNFAPSFIGGDAYKAYEIGKQGDRYAEAASTVMVDRITGLVAAMILSLFFALLNYQDILSSGLLIAINILIVLSLFLDIILTRIRKEKPLREFFKKILPEKITCFIHEIYAYNDNRKIVRKAIVWGMIFDMVGIGIVNYVLFLSLGIKIGIIDYFSVIFLTSIVSSLPISINNIGVKEWSYIAFFGVFGVSASAVVTAAIMSRVLQMLVSFFALPMYLRERLHKFNYEKNNR